MGLGGTGDEQPREISIGFRIPRALERNIIYIQISPKDETFSAEAVSNIPFNYEYKSIFGHYVLTSGIRTRSRDFGANGESFIEMLVQKNHGVRGCTLIADAYHIWDEIKQSPMS